VRGREVATGLDHASIPSQRFEKGQVAPAHERGVNSLELHLEAIEAQTLRIPTSLQQQMNEGAVATDRVLHYRPSTLENERDGKTVDTTTLQQHGKLLEVNEFTIVQDTGRGGRAVYSRAELERAAGDNVDALKAQLVPGNDVNFNYSRGNLTTTTLQDRGAERGVDNPQHSITR